MTFHSIVESISLLGKMARAFGKSENPITFFRELNSLRNPVTIYRQEFMNGIFTVGRRVCSCRRFRSVFDTDRLKLSWGSFLENLVTLPARLLAIFSKSMTALLELLWALKVTTKTDFPIDGDQHVILYQSVFGIPLESAFSSTLLSPN